MHKFFVVYPAHKFIPSFLPHFARDTGSKITILPAYSAKDDDIHSPSNE